MTDPPYGLGFMGKEWDSCVPPVEFWRAFLRVAKPGAHLVAFGGTRTWHRLAVAIEDAGWEIRDTLAWMYGQGFPKSLDVTAPTTDDAKKWNGWGTALKPAFEPIILARKPLIGTVAANVLAHGVGGINIDGCRVEAAVNDDYGRTAVGADGTKRAHVGFEGKSFAIGDREGSRAEYKNAAGRWPANVVLDEEAAAMLDEQTGTLTRGFSPGIYADSGGASRFFYVAKASRSERTHGGAVENKHPTVKPIALMRWLVRLVTPPGGLVLDPFCGSGTTLVAAKLEGFQAVGVELARQTALVALARWTAA